jgi:hypothetical protein
LSSNDLSNVIKIYRVFLEKLVFSDHVLFCGKNCRSRDVKIKFNKTTSKTRDTLIN